MKFVFLTIASAVYSQLVIKWRVGHAGVLPAALNQKIVFLVGLLCDPWVISAIIVTFLGGISWMIAMTRVELSYAYPFIGLVFVLILVSSSLLFHEAITTSRVIGVLLVIAGIIVASR
jgi:multidrug transporter EmrE-like cation transporter